MAYAKISMIALDLDGTCLDGAGKLTDRTRNILEEYGRKGTQIVFTTGRPRFLRFTSTSGTISESFCF